MLGRTEAPSNGPERLKARTERIVSGLYCAPRGSAFLTGVETNPKASSKRVKRFARISLEVPLVEEADYAQSIATFVLSVDKGARRNQVAFCDPGKRNVAANSAPLSKRNFIPQRNLHIMILVQSE